MRPNFNTYEEYENWQKWQASNGFVLGFIIITSLLIFGFLLFGWSTKAQAYTDEEIVNAIYKAEGSSKAVYLYGIRSVHYGTPEEAKQICLKTIRNNKARYAKNGHNRYSNYLQFLASRYCPIGARNDQTGVNRNWLKNVTYFLKKDNKNG